MPAGGFTDYANLMRALPGTARELEKRTGMGDSGVRRVLRAFWWLKLVHPGAAKIGGLRNAPEAVWMLGEGPVAAGLRIGGPVRALPQHISWAYLWRGLQDGATRTELRVLTGMSMISVQRSLKALRPIIRISEYERDSLGRPYPVWQFGKGQSKPRPKPPTPGEKWNRYQKRLQFRAIAQAVT